MSPTPNPRQARLRACLLSVIATASVSLSGAGPFSSISDSESLTAVSSSAHNGYVRARQADGSYQPETFAFGNGRFLEAFQTDQFLVSDPTIDTVGFPAIARMIAKPLASQNYLPARDPKSTNLLIMVTWGRTIGGVNISDGNQRDFLNYNNAKLLGFDSEGSIRAMLDPSAVFFGRSFRSYLLANVHSDVLSAVEENRYFVILRAYDFQSAWKQRKLKLLWVTRFSLSERRHDFERDLPAMAQDAALYFGQDTYGIVMKPIPEGQVHIGEVRQIDDRSGTEDQGNFDPRSGAAGDWQRTSAGPRLILHIEPTGKASFESPGQHVTVPSTVSTDGAEVTVKVPGWGMIIRGTVKGDRISGTLWQYDHKNPLTLTRMAAPGGGNSAENGDTLGK
jgi:hypothetical protein